MPVARSCVKLARWDGESTPLPLRRARSGAAAREVHHGISRQHARHAWYRPQTLAQLKHYSIDWVRSLEEDYIAWLAERRGWSVEQAEVYARNPYRALAQAFNS